MTDGICLEIRTWAATSGLGRVVQTTLVTEGRNPSQFWRVPRPRSPCRVTSNAPQRRNCTFAGCVVLLHYVPHTPPLPLGLREQWSDLSRDPRGEKQLVGVGAPLGELQPRPSGNVLPWCRATALSWHLVSSGFDLERVGYPFWVHVFEVEQTVKGWGPVRNK